MRPADGLAELDQVNSGKKVLTGKQVSQHPKQTLQNRLVFLSFVLTLALHYLCNNVNVASQLWIGINTCSQNNFAAGSSFHISMPHSAGSLHNRYRLDKLL
jgi:hypothetical protein